MNPYFEEDPHVETDPTGSGANDWRRRQGLCVNVVKGFAGCGQMTVIMSKRNRICSVVDGRPQRV